MKRWCFAVAVACLCVVTGDGTFAVGENAPSVLGVGPGAGIGAGRTFTFVYTAADGASDIATTQAIISTSLTGDHACYFHAADNRFWLRNDDGTEWVGPVGAGSARALRNSQCKLWASGSSVAATGDRLTMNVVLTFAMSFAGDRTIRMKATDREGIASD